MPELMEVDEEDEDSEGDEEDIGEQEDDEDPFADLSPEELTALRENTENVRTVLHKVRKLSFGIINSTTKALPAWHATCAHHGLNKRLIPRDVRTRWNSTFDMVKMAVEYRVAVDAITADKTHNLRAYE
ncbi:hypothetical protein H0H92_002278, partial [Tricholoma furcatifolium]